MKRFDRHFGEFNRLDEDLSPNFLYCNTVVRIWYVLRPDGSGTHSSLTSFFRVSFGILIVQGMPRRVNVLLPDEWGACLGLTPLLWHQGYTHCLESERVGSGTCSENLV